MSVGIRTRLLGKFSVKPVTPLDLYSYMVIFTDFSTVVCVFNKKTLHVEALPVVLFKSFFLSLKICPSRHKLCKQGRPLIFRNMGPNKLFSLCRIDILYVMIQFEIKVIIQLRRINKKHVSSEPPPVCPDDGIKSSPIYS